MATANLDQSISQAFNNSDRKATGRLARVLERVEEVEIKDPVVDNQGRKSTASWAGWMTIRDLLQIDPNASSRFVDVPSEKRLMVWICAPLLLGLLVFGAQVVFVGGFEEFWLGYLLLAIMTTPLGFGIAWVVIKRFLQTRGTWILTRHPVEDGRWETRPLVTENVMESMRINSDEDKPFVYTPQFMEAINRGTSIRDAFGPRTGSLPKPLIWAAVTFAGIVLAVMFLVNTTTSPSAAEQAQEATSYLLGVLA